jgi:hypothetical protein
VKEARSTSVRWSRVAGAASGVSGPAALTGDGRRTLVPSGAVRQRRWGRGDRHRSGAAAVMEG